MASISVIVATHGSPSWKQLAKKRAIPSTKGQGFMEVIDIHLNTGTVAQARNIGALQAHGDWLLFLDADDELESTFGMKIAAAVDAHRGGEALFTPSVQYVDGRRYPPPMMWPRIDFRGGNWCVIGTLIGRRLFHELGGFREYGMYEDWALWAMASLAGAEVIEVPEAIYIAHRVPHSRNRGSDLGQKRYWHQRIGHDLWPDYYAPPDPSEDEELRLHTRSLRFK